MSQSCPETAASGPDDSDTEQAAAQSAPEDGCVRDEEEAEGSEKAEAISGRCSEAEASNDVADTEMKAEEVPDSWEETEAVNADNRKTLCSLHSRRFRE